ncbi:MAG: phosphoenolpyruvate carboxylase [Terriglobia bacterium]
MAIETPTTMMTQHPDASRYVPVQDEPDEAIRALSPMPGGLGLTEAMIDFEGKLTPYQQPAQIVLGLLDKNVVPGRDVHITPRIPSGREEGVFRQLMALMAVVESNYQAHKKSGAYAIREVILPMTSGADELMSVKERILDVIELANKEFGLSKDPGLIDIIPLIETIPEIFAVDTIFQEYLNETRKRGFEKDRFRYMLGRSDLALSYGMVASVLANKIGISMGHRVERETGVRILPILGGGTLPFRGHLTLDNLGNSLVEYPGVRTMTVQSSMRYDHGEEKTRRLAARLAEELPRTQPLDFDDTQVRRITNMAGVFTKNYLASFFQLVETAAKISDIIPGQRDRLARKSAVGYARDLPHPETMAPFLSDGDLAKELESCQPKRDLQLPRAISFTAALYSIGLPPEIIGTGRGLREIRDRYGSDVTNELAAVYPTLRTDLEYACRFLHLENACEFIPADVAKPLNDDIQYLANDFGVAIGPTTQQDRLYRTIIETMKPLLKEIIAGPEGILSDESLEEDLVRDWILKLGRIRGALG